MSGDKKNNRQDLRVLQKNMVYCSGLPSNLTQDELKSDSYFGQYGKIEKIVINPFPNRNYCSVYLTYSHEFEAATTILACNEYQISRSTLWCLFGTMKYCKFFLKKIECKNLPNCPYLHAFNHKNEIEIQNSPSEAFPEHEKLAKEVFKKYPDRIKLIRQQNKPPGQLPEPMYAVEYVEGQNHESTQHHFKVQQEKGTLNQNEGLDPKYEDATLMQETSTNKIESEASQNNGNINENSSPSEASKDSEIAEQPENVQIDVEDLIRKLVLKQIEKTKGSKIISTLKQQEKSIKQVIIAGLIE